MSTFEDGQNTTQSTQNMHNNKQQQQLTPPKEESGDEGEDQHHHKQDREDATGGSNNNSIMGKMKKLSSIIPDSFSKWFSPGRDGGKASTMVGEDHQYNGQPTTKRKRGRRRIQLEAEEDDSPASGFDVDDGAEAPGLGYDEVALADNIAEHDLAAEDEQTRCNEYNNIYLFRKRRPAGNNITRSVANDVDVDDDDDDDDEEEDDEVPEVEAFEYDIDRLGGPQKQISKRRRVEGEKVVTLRGLRNLPGIVSSTPDHHQHQQQQQALSGSQRYAPHRMTHMNLYGSQRQREPAYNFFAGSEAAVATSGDLPFSTRRSLNIHTTDRSQQQQQPLPTYKRQSLLTHIRGKATPWRTSTTMDEVYEASLEVTANPTDSDNNNEFCPKNNNNNIITAKRSLESIVESGRESGEREGTGGTNTTLALGRPSPLHHQHHYGSNSNLDFYGNLQSAKSIFNRSSASGVVGGGHHYHHHNSTLSLNSLSRRRRFNASIYGSTSALSDSRLLSSSTSATLTGSGFAPSSPFYQGRTTFGGNSANNRNFSQGNLSSASASSLLAINSGGSSPAHPSSALTVTTQPPSIGNYGIKQIGASHKLPSSSDSNQSQSTEARIHNEANVAGISYTARRILQLLESYSSPLIDAQRMGSTLREHQVSRQIRGQQFTPYARPTTSTTSSDTTTNTNSQKTPSALRPHNLLQEMFETVERRRLHRVTQSSRKLVQKPTKPNHQEQQFQLKPLSSSHLQETSIVSAPAPAAAPASTATITSTTPSSTTGSASTASTTAPAFGEQQSYNHTNKMRSRLSHQVRKDMHSNLEAAPAPLDLPQISFPQMANAPKFDLVIKPTPSVVAPVAKPSVHQTPVTTNSTGVGGKPRRIFIFTTPLPLSPVVDNDTNSQELAGIPNAKLQSRRKFMFVLPKGLQEDFANTNTNTTSTSTAMVTTDQTDQPSVNGTTGSGFGLQFKKSSKEWECETCMIRNTEDRNRCAACESPKPGPVAVAPPITVTPPQTTSWPAASEGFGDRFKKSSTSWECDACMLTNKEEAIKCIACETPRKNLTKSTTSVPSLAPAPSAPPALLGNFGFGDAFKPKANTWECPTCMIANQSTVSECVACQTRNPKSSSKAASINESSTFKFGLVATPKPDEKFQQLVAAQKSNKWICDACMAQNEMNRLKCICCENLKSGSREAPNLNESAAVSSNASTATAPVPTFSFGFAKIKETTSSSSSSGSSSNSTSTSSSSSSSIQPPAPTAASSSINPNPLPLFSFGQNNKQSVTFGSPSTQFKFGIQKTESDKSEEQSKEQQAGTKMSSFNVNPLQQEKTSTTTDTSVVTSRFVFKSPIASTNTTTTTTATATATTTSGSGFTFGATAAIVSSSSSLSTVSSSTSSTSSGGAIKPMFQFTPTSGASASTSKVSSSTQAVNTQTAGGLNLFGVTTATTATVTPTPAPAPSGGLFSFGTQGKPAAATAPAATPLTFSSTSSPTKPITFIFGKQPATNDTTNVPAPGLNSNSIFGAGSGSTSNNTTLTTTKPSGGTSLAGFSFGENKSAAATLTDATTSGSTVSAVKSPASFTFGSSGGGSLGATSFGWPVSNGGSTTSTSSTTTAISSFSTTTTPAMAAAVVSSSTTTSSSSPTTTPHVFGRAVFGSLTPASGNLFGLAGSGTTTSGTTAGSSTPAMPILSGNRGATGTALSSVFGNSHPFGSSQSTPATTVAVASNVTATQQPAGGAAAATNIFGSNAATRTATPVATAPTATPTFGAGGGFGAATVATGAPTTVKPAFNFGNAASSVGTALTPGPFNFGASANVASTAGGGGGVGGSIKPAFNFTGSSTVATPQTATFNFTGNSGPLTGAAAASGNTGHQTDAFGVQQQQSQSSQQRVFQFGGAASLFNSDGNAAGTAAASPPTISSTNVPAMFNFTATPTQMQSTAPFQFSASGPSASASATTNIFAFNSPTAGNSNPNSTQMGRRKIRTTMRRLPPR